VARKVSSVVFALCAISAVIVGIGIFAGNSGCSRRGGEVSSLDIRGWVTSGNSDGATINVYDSTGRPLTILAPDSAKTYTTGTFNITVAPAATDFRIEAIGGTRGGAPFTGTLMAEVRGYNPKAQIVYLHPATTLVAAYLRKHPEKSFAEAEMAVKRFLQVPDFYNVAADLRGVNPYFDRDTFLNEAAANGGFDSFVAALMTEMDTGADVTHAFVNATPAPVQGAVDILTWSGQQFASGALSYLGSNAMSYVLKKFGIDMGGDPLAEVKQQLNQISTQLAYLQTQMTNMKQELSCDIMYYGYQGSISGINEHNINTIETISQLYDILLHTDPKDTKTINAYKEDILMQTAIVGLGIHKDIHGFATGNSSLVTQGAITGLSKMLKGCGKFINPAKSQAIQRQYAFVAMHQIQACQLVVNYYTSRDEAQMADQVAKECVGYIKDIQDLNIPNTLPANATSCSAKLHPPGCGWGDQFVDSSTGLVWWVGRWFDYGACGPYYPYMRVALADKRFMAPTVFDVQSFVDKCTGIDGQQTITCLANHGFKATYNKTGGTYFEGYPFALAANDLNVRQPPQLITGGIDLGFAYAGFDSECEFEYWIENGLGCVGPVDPTTGKNTSCNGFTATSHRVIHSDGTYGTPASGSKARVLLVRPLADGERYNW
jgi:hypothetical protein